MEEETFAKISRSRRIARAVPCVIRDGFELIRSRADGKEEFIRSATRCKKNRGAEVNERGR
jgi:hypothetical protein